MKIFNDKSKDDICRIPLTPEEREFCKEQGVQPSMSEITWRVFRIMAEFVEGFQMLSGLKREVTVLGSARLPSDNKWYQEAVKLGELLAGGGYTVITGGGPGIMEAANKGAYEAGGESIGINIQLPFEQRINPYVKKARGFHYFFTRKVILAASAQTFVYFPGGFGTMDELFEILTLVQTQKAEKVPVILVGKEFWSGLIDWVKDVLYGEMDTISKEDLDLFVIIDSAEEAYEIVQTSTERTIF